MSFSRRVDIARSHFAGTTLGYVGCVCVCRQLQVVEGIKVVGRLNESIPVLREAGCRVSRRDCTPRRRAITSFLFWPRRRRALTGNASIAMQGTAFHEPAFTNREIQIDLHRTAGMACSDQRQSRAVRRRNAAEGVEHESRITDDQLLAKARELFIAD